ncbi:hypothetical protein L195_g060862, partial [Trifolium pratense]
MKNAQILKRVREVVFCDFSEEGRQFSGNDSSSSHFPKVRDLSEERCRSPLTSKAFILSSFQIVRSTREMGSNDSFIK